MQTHARAETLRLCHASTLSRTLLHIGRHNSRLRKRFLQTSFLAQFGGVSRLHGSPRLDKRVSAVLLVSFLLAV